MEYKDYNWAKCSYSTFYKRIKKWLSFEEAIRVWHLMKIKNWVRDDKKKCKKCWIFKYYSNFAKMNNTHYSQCKDCIKQKSKERYNLNKEDILKKKKEKRSVWILHTKTLLDSKFYSDKNIKKIIKIDWLKKRLQLKAKWEILKDKFFYFLSKWFDRKFLANIYWWDYYINNER